MYHFSSKKAASGGGSGAHNGRKRANYYLIFKTEPLKGKLSSARELGGWWGGQAGLRLWECISMCKQLGGEMGTRVTAWKNLRPGEAEEEGQSRRKHSKRVCSSTCPSPTRLSEALNNSKACIDNTLKLFGSSLSFKTATHWVTCKEKLFLFLLTLHEVWTRHDYLWFKCHVICFLKIDLEIHFMEDRRSKNPDKKETIKK